MAQGGGIRPPDYLYEHAINRVEDLMVQAIPWPRIMAILFDEGLTESQDTAKKWRTEVMRRWAAEDATTRPARKDLWRARLERLYNTLLDQGNEAPLGYAKTQLYAEAIKVAKLSILLDGAHAPIAAAKEGNVDVAAMTPTERAAEIDRLLAKREAAQRAKGLVEGGN